MTKTRVLITLITLLIVGVGGFVALMYARGYRVNPDNGQIVPHGLLSAKSSPDGAQIFINNELKNATNTNISLVPDTYNIEIKKEGFKTWSKTITISQEEVTQIDASLFRSAPSLSALTFSGVINPVVSDDMTKIAYAVVPANKADFSEKAGLWVMETINLPIGFTREPRRITDGDLSKASWMWSPDGREILVTTPTAVYQLNAGTYTPQGQRTNVAAKKATILADWKDETQKRLDSKLKSLPSDLTSILKSKAKDVLFSPDEKMVMFTASGSATIPDNLVKPLPGSSTQKQTRKLEDGNTYVYDIKEDKNFLVLPKTEDLYLGSSSDGSSSKKLMWFPNSRNLVYCEENKITILDYDGTNRQVVFTGRFLNPYVFTTVSEDRLIILTDLGGNETPNLYTLAIK